MEEGKCVWFNGLHGGDLRARRCGAGVSYYAAFDGAQPGLAARLPCVQFELDPATGQHRTVDRAGGAAGACMKLRMPTAAELEVQAAAMRPAATVMKQAARIAARWAAAREGDLPRRAIMECPACDGRLHLSQRAGAAAEVKLRCATAGCLSLGDEDQSESKGS